MTSTLEDRLRTDLARVALRTAIPAAPASPSSVEPVVRRTRRRRTLTAFAAAGAVAVIGVPVAAAAGLLPPVRAAFGWSQSDGPVAAIESTGHLVLTTTGPGGQPMQLYAAQTRDGGTCVSLLLPRRHGSKQRVSSECSVPAALAGGALPLNYSGDADSQGEYNIISAPGATRLTLTDGCVTRSLPLADGLSGVWIPAEGHDDVVDGVGWARTLTLTSYGPSGAQLAQMRLAAGDAGGDTGTSTTQCPGTSVPAGQ